MADGELVDAREAMAILGINENELQILVARGDLRAFRSAGTMKFRRDDVLNAKNEKGTEPTIIIPATSGARRSSGILPTVGTKSESPTGKAAAPVASKRPAPPPMPAAAPSTLPLGGSGKDANETDQILLDTDFELVTSDEAAGTQMVTVQQEAINDKAGGQTVVEAAQTDDANETAAATAVAPPSRKVATATSPAQPTPAISRVAAAVSGSQAGGSRRTKAVLQRRNSHPIMTGVLILTTVVLVYTTSIIAVTMRGSYDPATRQRVIPPFLTDGQLPVYKWCYENTPGAPNDQDRPSSEFPPVKKN